ncbi:MAG TPA: GNAT family N-acetyltransferase [Candidatus Saccharimonadales bacterium]|nr:GNAT family N-acetyltransferase [Candidatus Saccharimonadales bacterium]
MVHVLPLTRLGQPPAPAHRDLETFDPDLPGKHRADAHAFSVQDGIITARASLWWSDAPPMPGQRLGVLGHFAAVSPESARELLEGACAELARQECSLAVGPMDGNTWRRYRFVTERGVELPFLMEPDHPVSWPDWWRDAGFTPLASYFSALNPNLAQEDPRLPALTAQMERAGVRIRQLDPGRFVDELRVLYAISRVGFQANFLYTPLPETDFIAQYESVCAFLRPELVRIAEVDGQPVGFVFGLPNLAQTTRGEEVDTAIVKTVAVLPDRARAGLGTLLVAQCQQAARALGYRRAIHALMHETNHSLKLSGHYAQVFRRYTLFARPLRSAGGPAGAGSA